MDPFSITVGVASLIGICAKVGIAVRGLRDGAGLVDVKLQSLLDEVDALGQTLRLIQDTLNQDRVRSSLQSTGHVGDHWRNVSNCVKNAESTLEMLRVRIERANKSVSMFDRARKHMRSKALSDEIEIYDRRVRTYRDALQLSVQIMIL